jgi:hypothetical protein
MSSYQVSKSAAHHNIRREVLQAGEARLAHRHPEPRYNRNITASFLEDDNLFIRELIYAFLPDCEYDFVRAAIRCRRIESYFECANCSCRFAAFPCDDERTNG